MIDFTDEELLTKYRELAPETKEVKEDTPTN